MTIKRTIFKGKVSTLDDYNDTEGELNRRIGREPLTTQSYQPIIPLASVPLLRLWLACPVDNRTS